jgi:hypothetical protein
MKKTEKPENLYVEQHQFMPSTATLFMHISEQHVQTEKSENCRFITLQRISSYTGSQINMNHELEKMNLYQVLR